MVRKRLLTLAAASCASLFLGETEAKAQVQSGPQVPTQATVIPALPPGVPAQPIFTEETMGGYSPAIPDIPQGDFGYSVGGYSTGACCPEVCVHGGLRGKWEAWKAKQQYKWWGYPEEFEEVPFGCATNSILNKQIAKGQLSRLALYDYDFVNGTANLNYRGRRRIADLIPMLQRGIGPLVVEEIPERHALNAQRRISVLNEVQNLWPGLSEEMVVVARPRVAGLSGVEGRVIHNNLINNTSTQGVSAQQFSYGGFTPSGADSGSQ